jgi:hypothetical protein
MMNETYLLLKEKIKTAALATCQPFIQSFLVEETSYDYYGSSI